MQTLQNKSGSGVVTLPKDALERDGFLTDDGEIPGNQNLLVERIGKGVFTVRLCYDGGLPALEETELVKGLAAQRAVDLTTSTEPAKAD